MSNFRNPQYNRFGTIDCEYEHPSFGWIPFTASPDDVESLGRELHAAILSSGQTIAPAPEPESQEVVKARMREYMQASAFQLRAALSQLGHLDLVEKEILSASSEVQLAWKYATEFKRTGDTSVAIALILKFDDSQMDGLFKTAMKITS